MNIPLTLQHIRPGEEWTLDGETYDGLTWLSDTAKPTEAEIEAAYPLAVAAAEQKAADRAEGLRKMAEAAGLSEAEIAALIG